MIGRIYEPQASSFAVAMFADGKLVTPTASASGCYTAPNTAATSLAAGSSMITGSLQEPQGRVALHQGRVPALHRGRQLLDGRDPWSGAALRTVKVTRFDPNLDLIIVEGAKCNGRCDSFSIPAQLKRSSFPKSSTSSGTALAMARSEP